MKVRLAAVATVCAAAVTATPAMGATVTLKRGCYREGDDAGFVATGFQPRQPIAGYIDGRQYGVRTTDAAGRFEGEIGPLSAIPRSQVTRALTVTQTTNPAITATKSFTETKLYVVTKPRIFGLGRRLRIRAGGFYGAGPTLYAHVRGPNRRNLRIGRVKGPCGKVSATRKVILKKRDRRGIYRVQFDTSKRFRGLRSQAVEFCGAAPPGPFCIKGYSIQRIFRIRNSSYFSAPVFARVVD